MDGTTDSMDLSLSGLGVGDGQGGLACCSPWGRKELDITEQLTELKHKQCEAWRQLTGMAEFPTATALEQFVLLGMG